MHVRAASRPRWYIRRLQPVIDAPYSPIAPAMERSSRNLMLGPWHFYFDDGRLIYFFANNQWPKANRHLTHPYFHGARRPDCYLPGPDSHFHGRFLFSHCCRPRRCRSRSVHGKRGELSPFFRMKSCGCRRRLSRFSRQPMHRHPPIGSMPACSHTCSRTL